MVTTQLMEIQGPCDFVIYNFTTPLFAIDYSSSKDRKDIVIPHQNVVGKYPISQLTFGSVKFEDFLLEPPLTHPSGRVFSLVDGFDAVQGKFRHFIIELKGSSIVGFVELLNITDDTRHIARNFGGVVLDTTPKMYTGSPIGYWLADLEGMTMKYYHISGKLLFCNLLEEWDRGYRCIMKESSITMKAVNLLTPDDDDDGYWDSWKITETSINTDGSYRVTSRIAEFGENTSHLQITNDGDLWIFEREELFYAASMKRVKEQESDSFDWKRIKLAHLKTYSDSAIKWIKFASFHGNRYIFILYWTFEQWTMGDIGRCKDYFIVLVNDAITSCSNIECGSSMWNAQSLLNKSQICPYHDDSMYVPQLKSILGITELCDLIASYVI